MMNEKRNKAVLVLIVIIFGQYHLEIEMNDVLFIFKGSFP
jgi:hypothetical protein